MPRPKQQPSFPDLSEAPSRVGRPAQYLDHGVETLVAQDNPDDSQLGAEPPAEGGDRGGDQK